jgi:tRNA1Val (adenine37-N6)-methyltransferase
MKVTTDGCLFGAWVAERVVSRACPPKLLRRRESVVARMLDIGAGTGLLSLMIAQKNGFSIDAIEMDKEAFEQASENIKASPCADRLKVIHADAREFEIKDQYDIIISNPPFYENELKSENNKKNLAHHNEGLLLPELLTIIKKNLKPNGIFYLLLPFKRNDEIKKLITEHEFFIRQITFVKQSVNHDPFRIMVTGKINPDEAMETMIDEITIKDDQDQYTPAFINLLKDYYLHL